MTDPTTRCPSDDALVEHVRVRPDAGVEQHLDGCSLCRRAVASLARESVLGSTSEPTYMSSGGEVAPSTAPALVAGMRVGRFALIEPVGRGGMAEVWAAYDPVLDRRVALKLLLPRLGHDQTFLIREARAVARLAHAHVIAVHDAGDVDGRVFIAMEYLPAGDLRRYLAETPRRWQDIVERFCAAGLGLAAAHRAGLVHRDFKSANVLLGEGGRIVVADFGLAGARGGAGDQSLGETISGGQVIGTPAYMAPEQHRGEPCDARSDQFSFCASLWQALYGALPFPGETAAEIGAAVLRDQRRDPPAGSAVPGCVRRAMERGLSLEPGKRFPSMDALLAVINRAERQRRSRWLVASVVMAGTIVGGAVMARGSVGDPCGGSDARWSSALGSTWTSTGQLAFAATGLPYADRTWAATRRDIDAYGRRWSAMHRAACEARRQGEQSAPLLDARMRCLDGNLAAAAALTTALGRADRTAVESVVEATTALPSIASCADVVALASRPVPPVEQRDAAAALEKRTTDLETRRNLGRHRIDPTEADVLVADAIRLGYAPALAAAAFVAARVADDVGDVDQTQERLDQALAAAYEGRDDLTVSRAAALRAWLHSRRDNAHAEARRWAHLALAAVERVEGDPRARARALMISGRIEVDAGAIDQAMRQFEKALALAENGLGPDDPLVGTIAGEMADGFRMRGDHDRAEAWATRELETLRGALGEQHPRVGYAWFNAAMAAWDDGSLDVAELRFRQAIASFAASLQPGHADWLRAIAYLAEVLQERGRAEESLTLLDTVRGGDAAPAAVRADLIRAAAAGRARLGRPGASDLAARALASAEEGYGEDSADLVPFVNQVMDLTVRGGGDGIALRDRALGLGAMSPDPRTIRAQTLGTYGRAVLARARRPASLVTAAIDALTTSAALWTDNKGWFQAERDRLSLAELLWVTGRDRDRARALADDAAAAARAHMVDDEHDARDLAGQVTALGARLGWAK